MYVIEFSTDVSVAILVECLSAIGFSREDFDIDTGDRLVSLLISYLELAESLIKMNLKLRSIVRPEELFALTIDLEHHVHETEVVGD